MCTKYYVYNGGVIAFRCSADKVSYHFIHANPSVLFENNVTFGLLVKTIIHFLLFSIIRHKCSTFNANLTLERKSTAQLIVELGPHVNVLRNHCIDCKILDGCVSISDIAHLLVLNKEKKIHYHG